MAIRPIWHHPQLSQRVKNHHPQRGYFQTARTADWINCRMCFSLSVANESKFVANAYSLHLLYIFSTYSLASRGQAKVRRRSGEGQAKRTNTKRALDKAIFIKISFRWAAKAVSSGSWTATWEMWKGHGEWWQRWSIVIGHVETEVMVKFVNHEHKWTKNQRNTSPLVLRLFQIGWRQVGVRDCFGLRRNDLNLSCVSTLVLQSLAESCRVLQLAQLAQIASWITRSSCGRLMDSWQNADRMRREVN